MMLKRCTILFVIMATCDAFHLPAVNPISGQQTRTTALFGISDEKAASIVWNHAKKPLLRIGAKGAVSSHGNSLKQLLEDHKAVKVKVNPKPYDGKRK